MGLTLGVTLPVVAPIATTVQVAASAGASGVTQTQTTASAQVTTNTPKLQWAMKLGETIYVNIRASFGPSAWVAYTVQYLFADGNAVLVLEPDCVAYTGPLAVGLNLRRAGESYATG